MGDKRPRISAVQGQPDIGVVAIGGPIDALRVADLENRLRSGASGGYRSLVLDLEEARYINSMGMAYLVKLSDYLGERGGALFLANPQPKVKLILEMMGLTELFKLHGTVPAALRAAGVGRARTPSAR
jgi:anti-sigma B factor antagonist